LPLRARVVKAQQYRARILLMVPRSANLGHHQHQGVANAHQALAQFQG